MTTPDPPANSRGEPQRLNPYAPSRHVDSQELPAVSAAAPPAQDYQARLTWADRQAFLKSVGPERLAAVIGGMLWLKNILSIERSWRPEFRRDDWASIVNSSEFVAAILTLGLGFFVLYLCWLQWRYADLVRRVAGGATSDLSAWSQLHLRTARLKAASMLLTLLVNLITFAMLFANL